MRYALVALTLALPAALAGQNAQAKIRSAMSAAPPAIAANATVKDWDGSVLREGTNGWTCYPDNPITEGPEPMCLDAPWVAFIEAFLGGRTPEVPRIGFGYMFAGDIPVSNTDPTATAPTPTNEWMEGHPHVMMIVPDPALLRNMPGHPDQSHGGPWVMWRNTPYAHVMIPLAAHGQPIRGGS